MKLRLIRHRPSSPIQ